MCALGYFEQFGKCVACPTGSGANVGVLFGIVALLVGLCTALFFIRKLLPIDVLLLGLSMLQVRAYSESEIQYCDVVTRDFL